MSGFNMGPQFVNNKSAKVPDILVRLQYLENNEYKITYWAPITTATGQITKPTESTIIPNAFAQGISALVETIVNGQPSGFSPVTAGGVPITVNSFDTDGNYTLSGTPSAIPVALLYVITIKAKYYQNLNEDNILALENSLDALNKYNNLSDVNDKPQALINLGGTTVGINTLKIPNPSAIRFYKINADNTVSTRSDSEMRSDLGLGTAAQKAIGSDAGDVQENGAALGASQIVETDANKKFITAAKNTAYNKAFGTTSNTVCEGNDSRFFKIPKVYAQTQLYTVGAVTTEVVSYSKLIPAGTIVTDDLFQTYIQATINNSGNAKTMRLYFSTANETVGNAPSGSATLFQTYSTAATGILTYAQFRMLYVVRSNTSIFGWLDATSTSGSSSGNNSVNSTAITVPTFANDVYFVVTGQKANSGDTLTIQIASMTTFKKE